MDIIKAESLQNEKKKMKTKDLTGQKIGRWTVLERRHKTGQPTRYLCECECGNKSLVNHGNLQRGKSKQCLECGREAFLAHKDRTKHGQSKTNLYSHWHSLKSAGKLCKEWEDFETFFRYFGHFEGYIQRKNPNKKYSPDNTYISERKPGRVLLTYEGKTQHTSAWADELGISKERMRQRYNEYKIGKRKYKDIFVKKYEGEYEKRKTGPTKYLTFNNKTLSLTEWAKHLNISPATMYQRHYEYKHRLRAYKDMFLSKYGHKNKTEAT